MLLHFTDCYYATCYNIYICHRYKVNKYFYISRSPPIKGLSQECRDSLLHQLQKFISSDTTCKYFIYK